MATDPGMLTSWYDDYMKTPPAVATAAPTPAAATTDWTPDANSTVAGQVASITAAGSPLIDQATTAAKQQQNAKGLLNSSLAITAGQDAVYRAALPMAQQDANTYAQAGQFNAGAKNTAALNATNIAADAAQFNAQATNAAKSQQNAAGISSGQQQQQFENQRTLLTQQTDEQLRLRDAENGTQLATAYRTASQQTYDSYVTEAQRIQESDMDPDVKAAQIANLQGLYTTRQEYVNTIFAYSPAWSDEWSQFALEFNTTGG